MLRLIGICLTLAGSFGSGLAFCREKSRHARTLFLLAELFWRMAEEISYSAERLPDVFSQMSVWLAKDAENDSFGKEEASALAEALLHCADRLEQERSEPLEVVWNAELGAWAAQTVLSREEAKKLLSFAKEQGFPDRNDKDSGCSGCPANSKAGRNLFLKRQRQKKGWCCLSAWQLERLWLCFFGKNRSSERRGAGTRWKLD